LPVQDKNLINLSEEMLRLRLAIKNNENIETKLIWSGDIKPRVHGAVSLPVFQSSTYEYSEESHMMMSGISG
jgi:hypothetical protein